MFNQFRSKYYALITLLSLLLNMIVPFYVVYPQASFASDTADNSVLFCTSQGVKKIAIADFLDGSYLSQLESYPSISHADLIVTDSNTAKNIFNHYECALCFVAQLHLDKAAQFLFSTSSTFFYEKETFLIEQQQHHYKKKYTTADSRAPPTSI